MLQRAGVVGRVDWRLPDLLGRGSDLQYLVQNSADNPYTKDQNQMGVGCKPAASRYRST